MGLYHIRGFISDSPAQARTEAAEAFPMLGGAAMGFFPFSQRPQQPRLPAPGAQEANWFACWHCLVDVSATEMAGERNVLTERRQSDRRAKVRRIGGWSSGMLVDLVAG